jgi:hypothetical protein
MGLNGVITKIVQVSDGIPPDSRHPRVLMVEVLTAAGGGGQVRDHTRGLRAYLLTSRQR